MQGHQFMAVYAVTEKLKGVYHDQAGIYSQF
jgi:hypothetical protein